MKTTKGLRLVMLLHISVLLVCLSCEETFTQESKQSAAVDTSDLFGDTQGCTKFKSPSVDMKYAIDSEQVRVGDKSLRIDYTFSDNRNQFIAFITKDMGAGQNWSQYDGVSLWSYVPKKTVDLRELSIVIYEEDDAGYVAQHVRSFKKTGWEESSAPFSSFVFSSGPPSHDKGAPPNLQKIRKIAVGIYQPVACADTCPYSLKG